MSSNLVFLGLHLAISKRECSPEFRKQVQDDILLSLSLRELDHGKVRVTTTYKHLPSISATPLTCASPGPA